MNLSRAFLVIVADDDAGDFVSLLVGLEAQAVGEDTFDAISEHSNKLPSWIVRSRIFP